MLAGKAPVIDQIKYPVLVTPKIDGIRCLIIDGKVLSRSFKLIPNDFVRETLATLPDGLDGELIVPGEAFGAVTSAIMRKTGQPDFRYTVFDMVYKDLAEPYEKRVERLKPLKNIFRVDPLMPVFINSASDLEGYERWALDEGYEGIMVRDPKSPYKLGRSTTREGYLLKVKRFEDDEAVVTGYEEKMSNQNERQEDAFGRTKRSTHQANMVPMGVLGALIVRTTDGIIFSIGSGLTDADRVQLWKERHLLKGRIVKFRHQPHGAKDAPRFPIFIGFRHKDDL
jgi:DNA ligase-1